MSAARIDALLLVGPTGAGKTPLGELFEKRGLGPLPVAHFDFGDSLRAFASGSLPVPELSETDRGLVQHILDTNALLTDDQFYIAAAILRGFATARLHEGRGLLLLNGLPRHAQQAEALADTVSLKAVIELACPPETVVERIHRNTGGDRTVRTDDTLPEIRRKLEIYAERTRPLVGYYAARGVPVVSVAVAAASSPMDVYSTVSADPIMRQVADDA